jgi:hypothetical protein
MSYPNFIGHGYSSCMVCHFNPTGNGPLTDYGRVIAATAIAGKDFYSSKLTDEKLAEYSSFFMGTPGSSNFKPSMKARWVHYRQNFLDQNEKRENILMQATAQMVWNGGQDKQWIVAGDFGYAPDPRARTQQEEDNYRTREHYIGYRFKNNTGIYVGLMDKPFGIKVPEHTAFSRALTANTMNDQVHGVLWHGVFSKIEIFAQAFVGNLAQKSELQTQGFSTSLEFSWSEKTRLGLSLMSSKNDYVKRDAASLHLRKSFLQGSSIIGEIGFVKKTPQAGLDVNSQYSFLQSSTTLKRGFNWLNTFEYSKPRSDKSDYILRFGPSLQYMPIQRLEFRLDILNSRYYQSTSVSEDQLYAVGQIHIWL